MDGGAGKGRKSLLLQKLIFQRKKQRTPLFTHLLLPSPPRQQSDTTYYFSCHQKANHSHIRLEAMIESIAAAPVELWCLRFGMWWTSSNTGEWQHEPTRGRCWIMLEWMPRNAESCWAWLYYPVGLIGAVNPKEVCLKTQMRVSSGNSGTNWNTVQVGGGKDLEAYFPVKCLGLWPGQDVAHSGEAGVRSHPPSVVLRGGLQDLLVIEEGFALKSWVYK